MDVAGLRESVVPGQSKNKDSKEECGDPTWNSALSGVAGTAAEEAAAAQNSAGLAVATAAAAPLSHNGVSCWGERAADDGLLAVLGGEMNNAESKKRRNG